MVQYSSLGTYSSSSGDAALDTVLFNRDMKGFQALCETGTLLGKEPFDKDRVHRSAMLMAVLRPRDGW